MIAISELLRDRWGSGEYIGLARPFMEVRVRRGYLQRYRRDDGVWTASWEAKTDWQILPGVNRCEIEQSFDSNGIATCTLELANIAYPAVQSVTGEYHRVERGWFSPFRAYTADYLRPGLGVAPNEWENTLATAAQIEVHQGYGPDTAIRTFTGLLDSVTGESGHLTLVARDFGQLLTDCHPFGWNIDPTLRDPITFQGEEVVRKLEASDDATDVTAAERQRKKWIIITDLAQAVTVILQWAGLPKHSVQNVGTSLTEATPFAAGEYLIDVIKKAQDVTGYTFFMGEPRAGFPLGEPIFRRSNVAVVPPPVVELRDDQLLTGLSWQRTDEPLAGIIRVRGKPASIKRGGQLLGGDSGQGQRRLMAVYRPPWHRSERDARLIRHVVHTEPLYKTEQECMVAAKLIALQEALAATTATIEIPCHPGLQLDDIIAVRDHGTGLATRCWIAQKQTTFAAGQQTSWTQSLGVSLLDTPDVVGVVRDLHGSLVQATDTDYVTAYAPG